MVKIIYVHPIFSVYGGAEKLMLDLFRRTKKDYEAEMYTLFSADYMKDEKGIYYGTAEEPPLKGIFGYKINPFNAKIIKNLGSLLAKNYKKGDIIMLTNFPAPLILQEAIRLNPEIGNGKNYLFSFEPDRILYYSQLKKLGYLPEDIDSLKLKMASKVFSGWRRKDHAIVERYIKAILTLSDYMTEQTHAVYPSKKIWKATDLYVDMSNFQIKSKNDSRKRVEQHYKFGLKDNDVIILSQSRIEKSKGIIELIDAVKAIHQTGDCPNLKLLIGGKGSLYEEVREKIKDDKNIYLLGFVPNELLPHIYGAADIFAALPRKETGGPLTILEGMYAGAITVGSNEGGPPELIENGKTGFLVDVDDQEEIVKTIKKAYAMKKNGTSGDMTALAKERVVKDFTFEQFYTRLLSSLTRKGL